MRQASVETQLRQARLQLKRATKAFREELNTRMALLMGIKRLQKAIGVNLSTMPADDPWRPHFEFWVGELTTLLKAGL